MNRKIEYSILIVVLCVTSISVAAPGFVDDESHHYFAQKQNLETPSTEAITHSSVARRKSPYLSLEALDTLAANHPVTIDDPQGGLLTLSLRNVESVGGTQTFRVNTPLGEPGTITRRGDVYYATIATRRGTYSLVHTNGFTQIQSQEQLNLHIIPGSKDYAVPAH